jgi:sugar lactone lactonase YvrE
MTLWTKWRMQLTTLGSAAALSTLALTPLAGCALDPFDQDEEAELETIEAGEPGCDEPVLLASGLQGSFGTTVGPGGDLFVTETAAGRISRVDRETGEVTTFASGLPSTIPGVGIGGPFDVAFIGSTAYALVTLVGADVGGSDAVGIYRVDGPDSFTVIADIGQFALANPPTTDFFIPTGVQFALQRFGQDFLVADGHHNRVLRVKLDGSISELVAFDNVVPTGLELVLNQVFMGQAGPVPHLAEDGRIVKFRTNNPVPQQVASGAPLLVDVELGPRVRLYGLSQGIFPEGAPESSPAMPDTGALVRVNNDGGFTTLVEPLDRPNSLEFVGGTAYVTNLVGEVWEIDDCR